MDATFILHAVKWVLAELLRLKSGRPPEETQRLLDTIVERHCPLIWKEGAITRVMSLSMKARDQVLVLLYDGSPKMDSELQAMIEYSNRTGFRSILRRLHKHKLIHCDAEGACHISPRGITVAEEIINAQSRDET
jgi:hypothetical protein